MTVIKGEILLQLRVQGKLGSTTNIDMLQVSLARVCRLTAGGSTGTCAA